MRNRITRPSPALVISIVALFVALGGTGYAAVQLPKGERGRQAPEEELGVFGEGEEQLAHAR